MNVKSHFKIVEFFRKDGHLAILLLSMVVGAMLVLLLRLAPFVLPLNMHCSVVVYIALAGMAVMLLRRADGHTLFECENQNLK